MEVPVQLLLIAYHYLGLHRETLLSLHFLKGTVQALIAALVRSNTDVIHCITFEIISLWLARHAYAYL